MFLAITIVNLFLYYIFLLLAVAAYVFKYKLYDSVFNVHNAKMYGTALGDHLTNLHLKNSWSVNLGFFSL